MITKGFGTSGDDVGSGVVVDHNGIIFVTRVTFGNLNGIKIMVMLMLF